MTNGAFTTCTGCGLILEARDLAPDPRFKASGECWALYCELTAYTQSLTDPFFHHQLAVDAYAAQHPEGAKPIRTAFALVGLYLVAERGFTGRQVQRVHTLLSQKRKDWPSFAPPSKPFGMTVLDAVQAEPGEKRLLELKRWVGGTWKAWRTEHQRVVEIVQELS